MSPITLHNGVTVQLSPRKYRKVYKRGSISQGMKAEAALPPIPATWSWTKGHTISLPLLGNGQAGNCVEADGAHLFQVATGCNGPQAIFTDQQVLGIYSLLTGYDPRNPATDRGTDPDAFFAWLKTGPGYPGGYKTLDDLVVHSADKAAISAFGYLFGPLSFGASLPNSWVLNPHPGQVWDAAPANPMNGHEFLLSGRNAGTWDGETWGFNPPVQLTDAGMDSCQPVVTATFCRSWFNAQGVAPNGLSYDALATLWVQMGGNHLPPFSPQPPPPPPPPPTPGRVVLARGLAHGQTYFYNVHMQPLGVFQMGDHPKPPGQYLLAPLTGGEMSAVNWQAWLARVEAVLKRWGPLAVPIVETLIDQTSLPAEIKAALDALIQAALKAA